MALLDYFLRNKEKQAPTASKAKERLQIIVAHEHSSLDAPAYLPELEKEIVAVIRKYIDISMQDVTCEFNDEGDNDMSILEVNVVLPKQK